MEKRKSEVDYVWYVLCCFVTWGVAYLIRVVISEGVRQVLSDDKTNMFDK